MMIVLRAHYDGKVLVPDEPLDLPVNQSVRIEVEPIEPSNTVSNAWVNYRQLTRRLADLSTPGAESLTESVSRARR